MICDMSYIDDSQGPSFFDSTLHPIPPASIRMRI